MLLPPAGGCGLNTRRESNGQCACNPDNFYVDGVNCCRLNAQVSGGACACKAGYIWSESTMSCKLITTVNGGLLESGLHHEGRTNSGIVLTCILVHTALQKIQHLV